MREHLGTLRRQRDRGRQRVAAVTTGGAAGATALAAAFGAVLAAGQSPPAAAPAPDATSGAAVQPVDRVAEVGTAAGAASPATVPAQALAPTVPAQAVAPTVPAPGAPIAAALEQAVPAPKQLRPPAQAPRATPKETAQAPSGAS